MWKAAAALLVFAFATVAITLIVLPFAFAAEPTPAAAVRVAFAAFPELGATLAPHLIGGLGLLGAILLATLGVIVVDRRSRRDLDFHVRNNLAPFALLTTAAIAPAVVFVAIAAGSGKPQTAGVLILAVPLYVVLAVIACYIGTYRGVTPHEKSELAVRTAAAAGAALARLEAVHPPATLPEPIRLRCRIALAASIIGAVASIPAWFFTRVAASSLGHLGHLVTTLICVIAALGATALTIGVLRASLMAPSTATTFNAWGVWISAHVGLIAQLLLLVINGHLSAAASAFGAILLATLATTHLGMRLPRQLHSLSIAQMALSLIAADLNRATQRAAPPRTAPASSRSSRFPQRWPLLAIGEALGAHAANLAASIRPSR